MPVKDAASLLLNIQYGLPALGPHGCKKKKGQKESSGILRWTSSPPAGVP